MDQQNCISRNFYEVTHRIGAAPFSRRPCLRRRIPNEGRPRRAAPTIWINRIVFPEIFVKPLTELGVTVGAALRGRPFSQHSCLRGRIPNEGRPRSTIRWMGLGGFRFGKAIERAQPRGFGGVAIDEDDDGDGTGQIRVPFVACHEGRDKTRRGCGGAE